MNRKEEEDASWEESEQILIRIWLIEKEEEVSREDSDDFLIRI